jgi:hypothetical protein
MALVMVLLMALLCLPWAFFRSVVGASNRIV